MNNPQNITLIKKLMSLEIIWTRKIWFIFEKSAHESVSGKNIKTKKPCKYNVYRAL